MFCFSNDAMMHSLDMEDVIASETSILLDVEEHREDLSMCNCRAFFRKIQYKYKKRDLIYCICICASLLLIIFGFLMMGGFIKTGFSKEYRTLIGLLMFLVGIFGMTICITVLVEKWVPWVTD